jgi:nucleotide-binding universal stress UspA family protein
MIKSILVPATGNGTDNESFASALAVARPFGAHIDFLHIRLDAASFAAMVAPEVSSGQIVTDLIEKIEEESDLREQRAKKSFESFCRFEELAVLEAPPTASTVSARWLRESGSEAYWLVEYARTADVLVIRRPGDDALPPSDLLELALLNSGRPLLIPPSSPMVALPDTIVIAWKATPEAARAVTAAMPLLSIAKQIIIATVSEDEAAFHSDGAVRLLASLRWHGLPVSMRRLEPGPGGPAETLLGAAREETALLVMGGYGHSRLREWIFGGFTQRILRNAEVPVLMAH